MYIVTKAFVDLEDRMHAYEPGDIYPRPGLNPTKARIEALLSKENRAGVPLIREVLDDEEPGIRFVEPDETAQEPPESAPDATDAD